MQTRYFLEIVFFFILAAWFQFSLLAWVRDYNLCRVDYKIAAGIIERLASGELTVEEYSEMIVPSLTGYITSLKNANDPSK